jgi:hypothetical protein
VNFFRKTLAGFKKVATFASAIEKKPPPQEESENQKQKKF